MPDEAKIIVPDSLSWVGTRPIRPDGVDKVTGKARFGADFSLPGIVRFFFLRDGCNRRYSVLIGYSYVF